MADLAEDMSLGVRHRRKLRDLIDHGIHGGNISSFDACRRGRVGKRRYRVRQAAPGSVATVSCLYQAGFPVPWS
jgi:hypothetical protein